ncbi:MAG: response regulator [Crocinitomicaceae bacterium]|nr:response regulator [Crocinitomicaceae bacterium]
MKKARLNTFIVEDDPFYANLIRHLLLENNYNNLQLFHSGEGCIRNLHKSPDVVILDHDLGQMDGLDVLKEIKSYDPKIEVVFLSGQDKTKVAVSALRYGAFDYLEKDANNLKRLIFIINLIEYTDGSVARK